MIFISQTNVLTFYSVYWRWKRSLFGCVLRIILTLWLHTAAYCIGRLVYGHVLRFDVQSILWWWCTVNVVHCTVHSHIVMFYMQSMCNVQCNCTANNVTFDLYYFSIAVYCRADISVHSRVTAVHSHAITLHSHAIADCKVSIHKFPFIKVSAI